MSSVRAADGFIYLGGGDGLYRLEGGRARQFRPNFYDPVALPAGRVRALAADGARVWVGTGAGLARLSVDNDTIERIVLPGSSPRVEIRALSVSGQGLVIATDQGAFLLAGETGTKLVFPEITDDEKFLVNAIATHGSRTVLATSRGLFELGPGAAISRLASPADASNVEAVAISAQGRVFAITSDRLLNEAPDRLAPWRIRTQDETPGLPGDKLNTLAFDPDGRLWIASRTALARARDPERDFVRCRGAIDGTDADTDMGIIHLSFGLGPYLLAGTSGSGAVRAPMPRDVRVIIPGMPYNPGLPPANIWNANRLPDGRILLGMSVGLFAETGPGEGAFAPLAPDVLAGRLVYSALPDGERIWVGTDRGLFVVSASGSARGVPLIVPNEGIASLSVYVIKRHQDSLLLGTDGGLFVLDLESGQPRALFRTKAGVVPVGSPALAAIPGVRVWSIDPFGDKALAAGDAHVTMLDLAQAEVLATTEEATARGDFVAGRVTSVLREDPETVLIGTEAGLIISDPRLKTFSAVSQINSAELRSIQGLGRSKDGQIWLGAAATGLFHRKPGEAAWHHLGERDGLVTNGVGQLGLNFGADGSLLVTNGTGGSIISPGRVQAEPQPPQTDVMLIEAISGRKLTRKEPRLVVPPETRELKFQFAVPEILESGAHKVQYSLTRKGIEAEPSEIAIGDDLNTLRPPAGTYLMSGRVVSAWGDTARPFAFEIEILPYWWERTETYLALFALITGLLVWAWRAWQRAQARRSALLANERKRIAQSLHDSTLQDIFGALLLSRSLADSDPGGPAREKGAQIAGLLNSATASLRRSIDVNQERDEVPDLSQAIRQLQPPAALAMPVDIRIAEYGRPWRLGPHRGYCALQIVAEALNNAAKHAGATCLSVELRWSLTALAITIADNGKGFDIVTAKHSGGFGLSGMRTMADAGKFDLGIEATPSEGTRVRLRIARFVL